jgi:putative flippase GtrA
LFEKFRTENRLKFLRFLVVGAVNTLFGFVVFALLAMTTLPTGLILALSNLAGVAFNFMTTGGLVFKDLNAKRIPKFVICYIGVFAIYWLLLYLLTPIFSNRTYAMAVIVLPMALLTFYVQSKFVFNDRSIT